MNDRVRRIGMVLGLVLILVGGSACSRRSESVWCTDLEEGLVAARLLKKDALILFSCATWPGLPGEFSRAVLADRTFLDQAADSCVLINLDVPQAAIAGPTDAQGDAKRLRQMISDFRVSAMPVFYLTDANGMPFSREVVQPRRSSDFLRTLEAMRQHKQRVTSLYNEAHALHGLNRSRKLDEALSLLPTDMLNFHRVHLREMLARDPRNETGLRKKYEIRFLVMEAGDELDRKNPDAALKLVDRIDSQMNPTGDVRQTMFLVQSRAFSAKQDSVGAFDALMRAREAAPHTKAAREIDRMLAELARSRSISPANILAPILQGGPPAGRTTPPSTGAPPPKVP